MSRTGKNLRVVFWCGICFKDVIIVMRKCLLLFLLASCLGLRAQDFEPHPRDGYFHKFLDHSPEVRLSAGGFLELGSGWSIMVGQISSDGYSEKTFLAELADGGAIIHDYDNAFASLNTRFGLQPVFPVYFGTRYRWLLEGENNAEHYIAPLIGYTKYVPYRDRFKKWSVYLGYDFSLQNMSNHDIRNLHILAVIGF